MPNLVLIRHSVPEIVPGLPASQWHLSQIGRDRCKALADKLAQFSPDLVLASSEPKATETAQLVAQHLNRTFYVVEGLHEHERSNVEFAGKAEFELQLAEFFNKPDELVMGEETANQTHERFANAIGSLRESHPHSNIAVVTHGTVITLFVARATGLDPFEFWRRLGLPAFVVLSMPGMNLVTVVEAIA